MRAFCLIFKVRKSHFGLMAFIQIFSYNTVLLALFCLDCSLSITKPATRGLFFSPVDRGLPPFDRGYTVICFTFAAQMGGFLFPFFIIRRRSPKCFSDSKNKFSLKHSVIFF
nr:MAG TPA: hypothetical protein [Caudoviricetes sp.]